ncbi:anthranilate phosphoribosyltransferase [Buchnera aphidicola]|uniref:Anthranilate phosphoribosyltransferase n=1 Tax=Buchnera aphidicola (Therioaphis trifolii) TaxID=1241884 RepID=A0A4D6YM50_9GAMM|nr:anthranilate phosphoribosyltransferase [Buchnera aphidicola]QCI27190.1 anthranilate phosphoribosyltransferase [Buchnera aphidicola (Therioaphis trifolii)]
MKKIFKKIYALKTCNELESYNLFKKIIKNKISVIKLTSILTILKIRLESINEIIGAIKCLQENSINFPKPKYLFADIAGTGGDHVNIINVSTLSALVVSSLGLKIIKHCNSGVSSQLGSADILKKNNINIKINPKESKKQLDKLNICFLYAPQYHFGFKYVTKIRKELKTRTIFNILGPLLNPSRPNYSVIGVYSPHLLLPLAKIVHQLNYERVILLHSHGIDEITLNYKTKIVEVKNGKIISYNLYPEDFGINRVKNFLFKKKTIQENYLDFKNICKGRGPIEYKYLIAMNAAILLKIFGYENLKLNTKICFEKIESGEINQHIKNISKEKNYDN